MNSSLRIVLNTGLVFVIMFLIFVTTFTKVGVPLDKTIKNKQILIDYKGAIIWGNATITLSEFIVRTDDEPQQWIAFALPEIDLTRLNKINGTKVPLEIYFKTWTIKKYSATFEERMAREGVFGEILALLRGNYIEVWGVQMRHFGNYGVTGLILSLIAAMLIENHREEQKLRGDSI